MITSPKPNISVLIPAFNREATIRQCIESVLANNYNNLEIIISDNGSQDDTLAIAREYARHDSRIAILAQRSNIGPVPNWRACLDHATGDLIHWMWSDDWVESNFYSELIDGMTERCAQVGICAARIISPEINQWHTVGSFANIARPSQEFLRRFLTGIGVLVSPASALLPRAACLRHFMTIPVASGLRCTERAIGVDALMIAGAIKDASKIYTDPRMLVNFRAHPNSISVSMNQEILESHYAWARLYWSRKNGIPFTYNLWDYLRLARTRSLLAIMQSMFVIKNRK